MKYRGFIDSKRLAAIGINYNSREKWFLDYVKSITKPLEFANNKQVIFEKATKEFVDFNGQILSLKAFIDDEVDPVARRTITQETLLVGNYVFTGYGDAEGGYIEETDVSPTVMSGYGDVTGYTLEVASENIVLSGFGNSEDGYTLETISAITLTFLIHNDVYSNLSQQELDDLTAKLKRYIIAPYQFEIKGYESAATFNGTTDYINTGIIPNSTTEFVADCSFPLPKTSRMFGCRSVYGNNFGVGISQYDQHRYEWGSTSSTSGILHFDTRYEFNLSGVKEIMYLDGVEDYDFNGASFENTATYQFLLGATNNYTYGKEYCSMIDFGIHVTNNGIKYFFTPHPSGYYFDNFGNIYYNQGESSNLYPLSVELTTY